MMDCNYLSIAGNTDQLLNNVIMEKKGKKKGKKKTFLERQEGNNLRKLYKPGISNMWPPAYLLTQKNC